MEFTWLKLLSAFLYSRIVSIDTLFFGFSFPTSSPVSEDPQLLDLEANLKGALLKIGVSESLLGRSPCLPCVTTSARSTDKHAFEVHMRTVQSAATELETTPHFQVSLQLCVQTPLPSCMHVPASCLADLR